MNETERLLQAHRTVRKYQDRPVDDATLNRILECGMRASNTGNMQVYSIVVTRDKARREALCAQHYGQGSTAPVLLTLCADVNRYHRWCSQRNAGIAYGNFLWFLSGVIDASLCAQNIAVAAESEGLGLCYLGTVLYNAKPISDLLQLPQGVVPVLTLSLGYPAEEPALSERLPLEAVVHQEIYRDDSPADIDRLHAPKEEFPFNKRMVEENGTDNLAQIFTQIRYPRAANEEISRSLLALLASAGFMNNGQA
ncbi:MAG: nitroreductase family protein [Bacteroidales bacterium]|nr:nitroreductase family protein [Bacteroidales bacterium]